MLNLKTVGDLLGVGYFKCSWGLELSEENYILNF
jgi:hypothetical protein